MPEPPTPGPSAALRRVALSPADAEAGLALSAAIGWNQTAADWRWMLGEGTGTGLLEPGGTAAATAVALPYGRFAWLCMVLVAPGRRRQGLATRLMDEAVRREEAAGRVPGLDATPAGREVYRRMGFRDLYRLARYRAERAVLPPDGPQEPADGIALRRLAAADLAAAGPIAALDRQLFGADRLALLRHLRRRRPASAFAAFRPGPPLAAPPDGPLGAPLAGYVLMRDGRAASHVGPLAADSDAVARALAAAALATVAGPVLIDVADTRRDLIAWLEAAGFVRQRPFIRMLRGRTAGFDDPGRLYAIAGPELG